VTLNAEAVAAALDARIARAGALAGAEPSTAALLAFYARLAARQRLLVPHVHLAQYPSATSTTPFAARVAIAAIAAQVPSVLAWLAREAPPVLGEAARTMAGDEVTQWHVRLEAALSTSAVPEDTPAGFVCEVVLQPFAEAAAQVGCPDPHRGAASGAAATCPCCGALPVVGVLRERGHGAGRALVCGRCLTEWPAPRMVCPACGGLEVAALPVFRADRWPAVRLDACDHCRTYLKSVDLTVDGAAIAVVDDLATLPLDLWAADQGFSRLRRNLLLL